MGLSDRLLEPQMSPSHLCLLDVKGWPSFFLLLLYSVTLRPLLSCWPGFGQEQFLRPRAAIQGSHCVVYCLLDCQTRAKCTPELRLQYLPQGLTDAELCVDHADLASHIWGVNHCRLSEVLSKLCLVPDPCSMFEAYTLPQDIALGTCCASAHAEHAI